MQTYSQKKFESASLPRLISLVENMVDGYDMYLSALPFSYKKIIGITGPPGAGKSTITDALIAENIKHNKKVAVLCVDPSSAFNHGALLGDRIRMSEWYNNENVYIRSLASRGSLGGLHPMILEITDVIKQFDFDTIIVETVGVGQSEIEIAALADITIVTVVPEAGDEIQTMKAGVMEIADIFVVNKADRPGADVFIKNLKMLAHEKNRNIPVIKTIATTKQGIEELYNVVDKYEPEINGLTKIHLLAQRAYHLIQKNKMKEITTELLFKKLQEETVKSDFNLYRFVAGFI